MLNAFVNGVSVADEDTMNSIIAAQDFKTFFEGSSIDSFSGAGVTENSSADYYYAISFTLTGSTEIGVVSIEVDGDNDTQDLTAYIYDDLAVSGTSNGTLMGTAKYPKEFQTTTAASTVYLPFGITGLTAGGTYWLVVDKVGDATDKFDLIGEASANTANQTYRRTSTTAAWSASNGIHYEIFDWEISGKLLASIYGNAVEWTTYNASTAMETVKLYIPGVDGSAGIRNIVTLSNDASGNMRSGTVT